MKVPKKELYENILSLTVLQIANYLLSLVTIPYLVRVLGPDKFGMVVFSQAFATYFFIITNYGFDLSATKKIARNRAKPEEVVKIFYTVLFSKLTLCLACFVFFVLLITFVPYLFENWLAYFISFLLVFGIALFPNWYFMGTEKMRVIALSTLVSRICLILGIFIFVNDEGDYLLAIGLQSLVWLIASMIALPVAIDELSFRFDLPNWGSIKNELKDGWHVFISTFFVNINSVSNIFILGLLGGNIFAGYYSVADKVVKTINALLSPVTQALFPYINSKEAIANKRLLKLINKSLIYMVLLSGFVSIVLYIYSDMIVRVIFGEQFSPAISLLQLMAISPVLYFINTILGVQVMLTFGLKQDFSRILIIGFFINILLLIPMINLFSINGAGLSFILAELMVAFMMFKVIKKNSLVPWG
jgi:PST family polysaccharide transporter